MKGYRPAKKRVDMSVGESVRIVRELQGLSQNALAQRTECRAENVYRFTCRAQC